MKPVRIEDFIGDHKSSGTQRNYRTCPMCANDKWKLYLDPSSGRWICFVCNASGKVQTYSDPSQLRKRLFTAKKGVLKFSPMDMPEFQPLSKETIAFIEQRWKVGTPEQFMLVRGAEQSVENRIVIPYLDNASNVIYWNARAVPGLYRAPKYLGAPGPHPLYVPEWDRGRPAGIGPTVVVEGAFDAMSVYSRTNYPCVALGGKVLPKHLEPHMKELLQDVAEVVVLLDREAVKDALKLRHRLAGLLPKAKVRVVICPGDDPATTHTVDLFGAIRK